MELREAARQGSSQVPGHVMAMYYLGAGDMEKCLDYLDASVHSRCLWALLPLSVDPLFKEVSRRPRAIALAKNMRLPFTG